MIFSYGLDPDQPQKPCCACDEYTLNHLVTPHGSYYLCQSCMERLAHGAELGQA